MGKSYSRDLRERVVRAVERDGLSRRKAAARGGDQDGDRLGSPVPADGAADGTAAGWAAAQEAGWRVSRVAAGALSVERLHAARAGG
jgi:transposase